MCEGVDILKKVLFLLLISIFLSGCTQTETEVFNFEGESDNWKVIYTAEILDAQKAQTKLKIQYIGEESIPEEGEGGYTLETNSDIMGGSMSLDDKGVVEIEGLAGDCNDCLYLYVDENEDLTSSISWNGNIEELKLYNDVTVE